MRFFFFKQKTAYEMRISDWSADVCSSDLVRAVRGPGGPGKPVPDVALPPHAHGDADHRLPPRHRRFQRRGLPEAGAGPDVLPGAVRSPDGGWARSLSRLEEHTSELQSPMSNSYDAFCLKIHYSMTNELNCTASAY